ncbi:MAG TPA: hypothetical protein V6D06_03605 [Trichocoleus sp.]
MPAEISSAFASEVLATLTAAANTLCPRLKNTSESTPATPDGQTVTAALLAAEKAAKQQRLTYALDDLIGTWRLCFTAPKKPRYQAGQPQGSGFYVPTLAAARIGFYPAADLPSGITIRNQLQVGPLQITFTGPARYTGKKNLLVFDFNHLLVKVGALTLYSGGVRSAVPKGTDFAAAPIGKLPFFAFFLACPDYVAARGRGGGLALWVREGSTPEE